MKTAFFFTKICVRQMQRGHSFRRALISSWRGLGRPVVRRPEHFNFGRESRKCGRGSGKVLGVLVFRALCAVQEVMALFFLS
jgi:hypothetical protein